MPLRNTERVLKNAGVDRLLELEHLERTERHAELFARLRVFQRVFNSVIALIASAHCAAIARSRHLSSASIAAPSRPNKLPGGTHTPSSLISAASRLSSVLKSVPLFAKKNPAASAAICGCTLKSILAAKPARSISLARPETVNGAPPTPCHHLPGIKTFRSNK